MKIQTLSMNVKQPTDDSSWMIATGVLVDETGERHEREWRVRLRDSDDGMSEAEFNILCLSIRNTIAPAWKSEKSSA